MARDWIFDANCQGAWTLDETSGTLTDASTNGNDSTGETDLTYGVAGQFGTAIDLNGTSSNANLGSPASLDNMRSSGGMSICAWINADDMGESSFGSLLSKNDASVGWWLQFYGTGTNTFSFFHSSSGTDLYVASSNNSLPLNAWHHLALTWDGSLTAANVQIYVDGTETGYQLQTDGTGTLQDDSAFNCRIGSNGTGAGDRFDGTIDELIVFDKELTSAEVNEILTYGIRGLGGAMVTSSGFWGRQ